MTPSSLRERATLELRTFVVLSTYLWICFGALVLYKSAILHDQGVAFLPLGFAALKAVVSAKFLMLGNFLPILKRRSGERLIATMLRKTLMLLVLLVALTLIEEGVLAMIHGRPLSDALLGLGGGSSYQAAAHLLLMLLILFPYVAFRTLGEALGIENLLAMLIQRAEADVANPANADAR
jgi:hypothetical protein